MLFRLAFISDSPTLEFDCQRSEPSDLAILNSEKKNILNELDRFITNPKLDLAEISEDNFFPSQLNYMKLNIFAIKTQAAQEEKEEKKYKYVFRK